MSQISRSYNRTAQQKRPLEFITPYYDYAEGSCLIKLGNTEVLCVASVEESAPPHLRGKGVGWVTAEYNMLPRSSPQRIPRERSKIGGRTQEIQRLIGRALRTVTRTELLGERSILIDCDVIKADGGTRTASITGAFIALVMAIRNLEKRGKLSRSMAFPIKNYLAATSVGIVQKTPVLDLDYIEDSQAETDFNIVMTDDNCFVELQGTAEKDPFSAEQLSMLLELGKLGCQELFNAQKEVLQRLSW